MTDNDVEALNRAAIELASEIEDVLCDQADISDTERDGRDNTGIEVNAR